MIEEEDYKEESFFRLKTGNFSEGTVFQESGNKNSHPWWSKKWIEDFETLESGNRIVQGKNYAKKGQVIYVIVQKGFVFAKVQDLKVKPYTIRIEFQQINNSIWSKVIDDLSSNLLFIAKLLAGKLPENINNSFEKYHVSLLPDIKFDVKACCSCPDWANPCKHTAAVFYILAEMFKENPFLYFKLRGKTQREFLSILTTKMEIENLNNQITYKTTSLNRIENPINIEKNQPIKQCLLNHSPEFLGIDLQSLLKNTYSLAKNIADKILDSHSK